MRFDVFLQRPDGFHGLLFCRGEYGQERCDCRSNRRDGKQYQCGRAAEYEDRGVESFADFAIDQIASRDAARDAENKADQRDDERFGIENFEYVGAARAHRAKNTDFFLLVGRRIPISFFL